MPRTAQQVLHLMTSNKKPIQVTTTQVDQWFSSLEAPNALARFGLKNAPDVISFLNSPAGKATMAIVAEKLANMEDIRDAVRVQQQTTHQHHRHLILLLLGLIYDSEIRAEKLNIDIQAQIDKNLHQHELDDQRSDDDQSIYNEAANSLEQVLNSTLKESEQLEFDLSALIEERLEIDLRYRIYDEHLDAESIKHLSLQPELIDIEINDLESKLSSYAIILTSLINEGKHTEAREAQTLTHALNLKSDLLNTMKMAHQQEKRFFNHKAESVQSFAEADFILAKDKALALEGNHYYLYPKGNDFSKFSLQQKHDAQNAYQLSRYDIMSIKMQIQLNRTQELSLHQTKKTELLARSEAMQQNIHLLTKQLAKVRHIKPRPINTNTHSPLSLLKKPELQQDPLKTIIHQSRMHIERLMSGQQPSVVAKNRMDEIKALEELKLRTDSPRFRASMTPQRGF